MGRDAGSDCAPAHGCDAVNDWESASESAGSRSCMSFTTAR